MLVLSRKTGQSIYINDDIEITVTEISGDKVRIGIEAPSSYRIMRQELRQTEDSNRAAAEGVVSKSVLRRFAIKRADEASAATPSETEPRAD